MTRTRSLIVACALAALLAGCGGARKPVDPEKAAARAEREVNRKVAKARPARPGTWGSFSGPVEARWEEDGVSMVLLKELRYTDPYGEVWVAPAGSRVDGASIPRAFWSIIGGPFEGKYRAASVLHDVAYEQQTRPWQEVDRMFYNAMRASDVGAVTAKTMYYALYRHGRHWKHPRAAAVGQATRRPTPADVEEIQRWIQTNDPSLEDIETRAAGAAQ